MSKHERLEHLFATVQTLYMSHHEHFYRVAKTKADEMSPQEVSQLLATIVESDSPFAKYVKRAYARYDIEEVIAWYLNHVSTPTDSEDGCSLGVPFASLTMPGYDEDVGEIVRGVVAMHVVTEILSKALDRTYDDVVDRLFNTVYFVKCFPNDNTRTYHHLAEQALYLYGTVLSEHPVMGAKVNRILHGSSRTTQTSLLAYLAFMFLVIQTTLAHMGVVPRVETSSELQTVRQFAKLAPFPMANFEVPEHLPQITRQHTLAEQLTGALGKTFAGNLTFTSTVPFVEIDAKIRAAVLQAASSYKTPKDFRAALQTPKGKNKFMMTMERALDNILIGSNVLQNIDKHWDVSYGRGHYTVVNVSALQEPIDGLFIGMVSGLSSVAEHVLNFIEEKKDSVNLIRDAFESKKRLIIQELAALGENADAVNKLEVDNLKQSIVSWNSNPLQTVDVSDPFGLYTPYFPDEDRMFISGISIIVASIAPQQEAVVVSVSMTPRNTSQSVLVVVTPDADPNVQSELNAAMAALNLFEKGINATVATNVFEVTSSSDAEDPLHNMRFQDTLANIASGGSAASSRVRTRIDVPTFTRSLATDLIDNVVDQLKHNSTELFGTIATTINAYIFHTSLDKFNSSSVPADFHSYNTYFRQMTETVRKMDPLSLDVVQKMTADVCRDIVYDPEFDIQKPHTFVEQACHAAWKILHVVILRAMHDGQTDFPNLVKSKMRVDAAGGFESLDKETQDAYKKYEYLDKNLKHGVYLKYFRYLNTSGLKESWGWIVYFFKSAFGSERNQDDQNTFDTILGEWERALNSTPGDWKMNFTDDEMRNAREALERVYDYTPKGMCEVFLQTVHVFAGKWWVELLVFITGSIVAIVGGGGVYMGVPLATSVFSGIMTRRNNRRIEKAAAAAQGAATSAEVAATSAEVAAGVAAAAAERAAGVAVVEREAKEEANRRRAAESARTRRRQNVANNALDEYFATRPSTTRSGKDISRK